MCCSWGYWKETFCIGMVLLQGAIEFDLRPMEIGDSVVGRSYCLVHEPST